MPEELAKCLRGLQIKVCDLVRVLAYWTLNLLEPTLQFSGGQKQLCAVFLRIYLTSLTPDMMCSNFQMYFSDNSTDVTQMQ